MRMALEISGIGDAHELSGTESLDVPGSAITHSCAEAADKLVHNLCYSAIVRYLGHDSFRNELLDILFHIRRSGSG